MCRCGLKWRCTPYLILCLGVLTVAGAGAVSHGWQPMERHSKRKLVRSSDALVSFRICFLRFQRLSVTCAFRPSLRAELKSKLDAADEAGDDA
jgi:hypothetical protein